MDARDAAPARPGDPGQAAGGGGQRHRIAGPVPKDGAPVFGGVRRQGCRRVSGTRPCGRFDRGILHETGAGLSGAAAWRPPRVRHDAVRSFRPRDTTRDAVRDLLGRQPLAREPRVPERATGDGQDARTAARGCRGPGAAYADDAAWSGRPKRPSSAARNSDRYAAEFLCFSAVRTAGWSARTGRAVKCGKGDGRRGPGMLSSAVRGMVGADRACCQVR